MSSIDPSAVPSANLPVIPDKVAEQIQAGKDVPLEAISEAAAEMKVTRESTRATPLHGDTLRPISRAQANTLMTGNPQGTLQRGSIPRAPVTRRVIPPPFKRESISIRVPGEPQPQWQNLRAEQVTEGMIVPNVGRVVSIKIGIRYREPEEVVPVRLHEPLDGQDAIPGIITKTFDGGEYELLREHFGRSGARVAVGTDIMLTGPEGNSITVDAKAEVRAFGL